MRLSFVNTFLRITDYGQRTLGLCLVPEAPYKIMDERPTTMHLVNICLASIACVRFPIALPVIAGHCSSPFPDAAMPFVTFLWIFLLAGCASSTAAPPASQTLRIVDAGGGATQLSVSPSSQPDVVALSSSAEDVWRVLPAVFEMVGIPVTERNSTNRVIGNPGHKVRRQMAGVRLGQYVDCGRMQGVPSADTYELTISVLTRVVPAEDRTSTLQTTVQAIGQPVNFASSSVNCWTTRSLEARIVELVKQMVGETAAFSF
ncbi:hypothetical protein BH23GEM8_BH23GEM8_00370 [soil metagenome]